MSEKFPQYARTNDVEVLAVMERNKAGREELIERAVEFSKRYGDDPTGSVFTREFGIFWVTGIVSSERPSAGRWKQLPRTSNGWVPYANNPLSGEFSNLKFKPEPVPGIPEVVDGPMDRNGSSFMATPKPFELDGHAYVGLSFQPVNEALHESPWDEIKASEFHAAMETYNERLKQ